MVTSMVAQIKFKKSYVLNLKQLTMKGLLWPISQHFEGECSNLVVKLNLFQQQNPEVLIFHFQF